MTSKAKEIQVVSQAANEVIAGRAGRNLHEGDARRHEEVPENAMCSSSVGASAFDDG